MLNISRLAEYAAELEPFLIRHNEYLRIAFAGRCFYLFIFSPKIIIVLFNLISVKGQYHEKADSKMYSFASL